MVKKYHFKRLYGMFFYPFKKFYRNVSLILQEHFSNHLIMNLLINKTYW